MKPRTAHTLLDWSNLAFVITSILAGYAFAYDLAHDTGWRWVTLGGAFAATLLGNLVVNRFRPTAQSVATLVVESARATLLVGAGLLVTLWVDTAASGDHSQVVTVVTAAVGVCCFAGAVRLFGTRDHRHAVISGGDE